MSEVEIALFPIPGSVSLPYSKVPLHVFEPRYRKMINDCVAAERRIGVAHTQRALTRSKPKNNASVEDLLKHNQQTYVPQLVFSAGFVEIIETLPDGRMLVEVSMDNRYVRGEERQSIPYQVFQCSPFEDEPETLSESPRQELDQLFLKIVGEKSENLKKHLTSPEWLNQSLLEYSFKIYSLVELDPDDLQKVLEFKSPTARINFLKDAIHKASLV